MASTYDVGVYDTAVYDDFTVGGPLVELYLNSAWVDVTSYVRVDSGITIVRGRQDETSQPTTATCTLTFDNRDGRFSPRYSGGAYYGYLTRNTQLRVSVYLDDGTTTIRYCGFVSEWPVQWDPTGRESTVTVTASGYRRRLQQSGTTVAPPYRAAMLAASGVVGYWPMEDGSASTMFGSALSQGSASTAFRGITPAADGDTFDCSDALPTITDNGLVQMFIPTYTSPGCITVRALVKVSGSGGGLICQINTNGAHYFLVEHAPATNALAIAMYNKATGVQEYTRSVTWTLGGHNDLLDGCRLSIELKQNGTGIDNNIVTYTPGNLTGTTWTVDTIPLATLGACTDVAWIADPAGGMTATIGHTSVQATAAIPSIFDLGTSVLTAYNGEAASTRVVRLCTAFGIPATVAAGIGSAGLGPQQKDIDLVALIDDAALCDDGISTEVVDGFGLKWRARSDMYSQASFDGVTYGLSGFPSELVPVDDDQNLANDVTVSRTDGASARATDSTSALGTTTIGAYSVSYDLNLWLDSQVTDQANWRLVKGTINSPRYPVIAFDVMRPTSSAHRTAFVTMREGDNLLMTNLPGFAGPSTQNVRVLGWTEYIDSAARSWMFRINAVPADPWDHVFRLDDAQYGVLDTDRLGM